MSSFDPLHDHWGIWGDGLKGRLMYEWDCDEFAEDMKKNDPQKQRHSGIPDRRDHSAKAILKSIGLWMLILFLIDLACTLLAS